MDGSRWAVWAYTARDGRWMVVDSGGYEAMSESLRRKRAVAAREGLNPDEYAADEIDSPPMFRPSVWPQEVTALHGLQGATTDRGSPPRALSELAGAHDCIEAARIELAANPALRGQAAADANRELETASAHVRNARRALVALGGG